MQLVRVSLTLSILWGLTGIAVVHSHIADSELLVSDPHAEFASVEDHVWGTTVSVRSPLELRLKCLPPMNPPEPFSIQIPII